MIVYVFVLLFNSPGKPESTGETTGGVVGKRNRNVVIYDRKPNPRLQRGLVEQQ